jgi:hypothetical protein
MEYDAAKIGKNEEWRMKNEKLFAMVVVFPLCNPTENDMGQLKKTGSSA